MMLRNLLATAAEYNDGPMAIRYPRGSGRNIEWQNQMETLPIGKGRKVCDGSDIAILSLGPISTEVEKAIEQLRNDGISAAHYDMIYLKPIDTTILEEVAAKNCPIVTVEDASVNGGLGSAVSAWLSENGLERRVMRVGIPDTFIGQGSVAELYKQCGMDAMSIVNLIKNIPGIEPANSK